MMVLGTIEISGLQAAGWLAGDTRHELAEVLEEAGYFRMALTSVNSASNLKRLLRGMLAWIHGRDVLAFHLQHSLEDLIRTLEAHADQQADLIDLEISKCSLLESLRICVQLIDIELDLIS